MMPGIAGALVGLTEAVPMVMPAPVLSLAGSKTAYPPSLAIELDNAIPVGSGMILRISDTWNFAPGTYVDVPHTITSAEAIANAASLGAALSSITTPKFFKAWMVGGAESNVVAHGDGVAPTLSGGGATSSVENAPMAVVITADEPCYFVIGGTDGASLELYGSQPATSIVVRRVGNANLDYETKQSYAYTVIATDLADNASSPLAGTHTVLNDTSDDPPEVWPGIAGFNRNTNLHVSGAVSETLTAIDNHVAARSKLAIVPDKYHFEVTLNGYPTGTSAHIVIGLDNGSQDFSDFLGLAYMWSIPHFGGLVVGDPGFGAWNSAIICDDSSYAASNATTFAAGDVIVFEGQRSTGAFDVRLHRGGVTSPVASGTLRTYAPGYIVFGTAADAGISVTLNMGETAFAVAPTATYSAANGS